MSSNDVDFGLLVQWLLQTNLESIVNSHYTIVTTCVFKRYQSVSLFIYEIDQNEIKEVFH